MPQSSISEGLSQYVEGYPKLAGYMTSLPEVAIFRRFGALNARNLLYLQAELTDLEAALLQTERRNNMQMGKAATCKRVYNLVQKIREKLKEYNKALYYQAMIHQLKQPDELDFHYVQKFIACNEMKFSLSGQDQNTWGVYDQPNSYTQDGLVTLQPRELTDMFSSRLSRYMLGVTTLLARLCGRGARKTQSTVTVVYHDSTISKITFWLMSMIASSIPVLSIIALLSISSLKMRLAAIAGFNGLVSLCLLCFTDAKRLDIFAITAA